MKKSIIAIALLCAGVAVSAATAKEMKSYKATVPAGSLDVAVYAKDVLAVYSGTTNLTFKLIKANKDLAKAKTTTAWINVFSGGKFDKTTDTVKIIGFKGKTAYILVDFADVTKTDKILSLNLKTYTDKALESLNKKSKTSKASKVNGSITAVAGLVVGDSVTTDGVKVWVDAGATVDEYNKKLDKKKYYTVGAGTITLPVAKSQYIYDINGNSITISK